MRICTIQNVNQWKYAVKISSQCFTCKTVVVVSLTERAHKIRELLLGSNLLLLKLYLFSTTRPLGNCSLFHTP